jgi:glycosyltransferase domain-containing protein
MSARNLSTWLTSVFDRNIGLTSNIRETLTLLTVIIPCYGRQDFLMRQCAYWHNSGASIIIVDGSPKPLDVERQEIISKLNNISYLYLPIPVTERLHAATEYIKTPYSILLGDDEFLLFSGLCSAISKLENNTELVAVIGQSISFFPAHKDNVFGCHYGPGYPHWRLSVEQDDIDKRFETAMSNYSAATCYAVLRSPIWCKSWGQQENWSSPYVGEIQQALTTYIWGKLTTVDQVYWMRSSENSPVNTKEFNRGLSFEEWWISPANKDEQIKFIDILAKELASATKLAENDAQIIIKKAVETYVQWGQQSLTNNESINNKNFSINSFRPFIVHFFKWLLPTRLQDYIKSILFNIRSVRGGGDLGTLTDLKSKTANVPFEINDVLLKELSEMEALICGFYAARKSM